MATEKSEAYNGVCEENDNDSQKPIRRPTTINGKTYKHAIWKPSKRRHNLKVIDRKVTSRDKHFVSAIETVQCTLCGKKWSGPCDYLSF